jgi:phenylpropionate dioxygenase-like ring-hydroxylating dioxygenase large terminal subunit
MEPELKGLVDSLQTCWKHAEDSPRTLEPGHYTSQSYFALEIERIWKKEWICIGHVLEVRNPGDYFTVDLVGEPIMIVRGEDHNIRALSTVCRHRLMLVSKPGESGNTTQFVCPYHRWTYGLDGRLESTLHMERNQSFVTANICLPQFRVELWNDLIWVNLDDDAAPLAPKLTGLEEAMSVYRGPEGGLMTELYDKAWGGNWKSQVENNLEGYHHMGMHEKSIETYSPTKNVTNLTFSNDWTRHQVPYERTRETTKALLDEARWKPDDWIGQAEPGLDIINIHPGNSFSIYPGGAGFYTIWPVSRDQFHFRARSIRAPKELRRFDVDGGRYDSERVLDEDGVAMPLILHGAGSSKAEPGLLSWMEASLPRWHEWMARRMSP